MRTIDPGHVYALDALDGLCPQQLTFVKRVGDLYPGNKGAHPGTTSQEVLRALIERADYVNAQLPCAETQLARDLMAAALYLLEARASRRHGRSLVYSVAEVVAGAAKCALCGHVGCHGRCKAAAAAAGKER